MKNWLGSDLEYVEQCDGDLGDKMLNSVLLSFLEGIRYLVQCNSQQLEENRF